MKKYSFIPLAYSLLSLLMISSCGEPQKDRAEGNTLGGETSPYLQQHASNPVHWKAWDESIFEKAEVQDKLVLISIGYSSCHWCHVMEEETFENDSVAAYMNENYISVKVDREERPDVDQVYMTAVQLMTGSGGWPLNVIVLPNGKPIYGGTYHTRERWLRVLNEVQQRYESDPQGLSDYADRVAQGIQEVNLIPETVAESDQKPRAVEEAVGLWQSRWDVQWGGNAGVQKFMLPCDLSFLMTYSYLSGDQKSRDHVKTTLDRMAHGGIFDQIGGGFFRYSTDSRWHIPHFEKMLYDNAQLLSIYSKGYQLFSDQEYKEIAERILSFLIRDMKAPDGGFYAALDADSEGEEGKFYRWTSEELQKLVGSDYELFSAYYGIVPEMVWESEFFVPYRRTSDTDFAKSHKVEPARLERLKRTWQNQLLQKRSGRVFPGIDDKIITSWNALLVIGLTDAFDAFGDGSYLDEARGLYAFLKKHSYDGENLRHSFKPGDTRSQGFLEDYAYLARAAFRLYQVTSDPLYLTDAQSLLDEIQTRYSEGNSSLYRYRENPGLVAKIIKTDDGVMPSPNTVVAGLLFELGHFYYRPEYLEKSRDMMGALRDRFFQMPENYAGWGQLLLQQQHPFFEVAVAGPQALEMRGQMARPFHPDVLLVASETPTDLPLFESRFDPETTRIFVCRDHTCRLPVNTVDEALSQLQSAPSFIFP